MSVHVPTESFTLYSETLFFVSYISNKSQTKIIESHKSDICVDMIRSMSIHLTLFMYLIMFKYLSSSLNLYMI